MKVSRRRSAGTKRGFTLIELMIVVAVVGVLAALSVYSLRRYMTAAKSSEAKSAVGAIARSAHAAFEREQAAAQTVMEGSQSIQASHQLCGTAVSVPLGVPAAKKYQPGTADGSDFSTGSDQVGWICLRFRITHPIYHQYTYTNGTSPSAPLNPAACNSGVDTCYEVAGLGDLNGNGLLGRVARTGFVNPATGTIKASTQIYSENLSE